MKHRFSFVLPLLLVALLLAACGKSYTYESVAGDPLNARIYTLDNGLKVYLTVNKDQPRIQTYIAVRVGGKNDPAETTGLSHYLEHLMFKGTTHVGTQNYEAELPLLDSIEANFEVYRHTTDSLERLQIYHVIDSLSYEASLLTIANEYDKLMATIGANGTNAYTSYDVTCYTEDIPSNQVENWAKIQADRFENMVIRGFHTELETVYEEKNMSLTSDNGKAFDALLSALFPHHPYGTQTIIGTQEHLKNPSITNIKRHFAYWYVPNNMAICMSGDLDPDATIRIIDRYFGGMEPNPELTPLQFEAEPEITEPIEREVYGQQAEMLYLAWRMPGAAHRDIETLQALSMLLYNGQAGLIDLDINQQQLALDAAAEPVTLSDYSIFAMMGQPGPGQTLDEVRQLLLNELRKLREGDFDERLLEAGINNFKLARMQSLERNRSRANAFVDAFINGVDWEDEVTALDRISQLTKQDIVDFANRYLNDDNYVAVYKRQGKDPNELKIAKPQITPIAMNRDTASAFLQAIQAAYVEEIEPVFVDFDKELTITQAKDGNLPVIYKKNESSDLFDLMYIFDMGTRHDKAISLATGYLDYLGTEDMSAEEIKSEFYRLACSYRVQPGIDRTYITLSGLNENLPQAVALLEKLLAGAVVDREKYVNQVSDILKSRRDVKFNQSVIFGRLRFYAEWGPQNASTYQLSEHELKAMDPQELVDRIHNLLSYKHRIAYYGPSSAEEIVSLIDSEHGTPEQLRDIPEGIDFTQQLPEQTTVFLAPYDAANIYMAQVSCRNEKFDASLEPARQLYNEYFGGGMNGIVFQEMRESRGLAYSASASLSKPTLPSYNYTFRSFIATQNDKMMDAVKAFNDIIDHMPQSETAFQLAKDGLLSRLRTERTIKDGVIWGYINAQDFGLTTDGRRELYEYVQQASLQDVIDFQQQNIQGRTYNYCIVGDRRQLDMKALATLGRVEELTLEQIFGY